MAAMQRKTDFTYITAVLTAGTLWGFMGLFRRYLGQAGVDSAGIIFLRCGTAAIFFFATLLTCNPDGTKIRLKDLWCFLGTGLCSMLFFTYCYFQAMNYMSLSVAAILLYTAPVFVVILSAILFREPFDKRKMFALVLAFAGCCFVSGLGSDVQLSVQGMLFGLGAGVGYALYSIFAKFAIERGYETGTINLYTQFFASLGAALIWGVKEPLKIAVSSPELVIWTLALGLITCYLPYMLYTYSLTGLEAGRASIYANVEPVVATIVGVFLFQEKMTPPNLIGIVLVMSAVLRLGSKQSEQKNQ